MPVTKQCEVCGTEFSVPPSRDRVTTCSRECGYKARNARRPRDLVVLQCKLCKKEFRENRCHAARRTYCSTGCRDADPAYISRKSEQRRGEKNPQWNGGIAKHPDGYKYQLAPPEINATRRYVLQHRIIMLNHLMTTDPDHPAIVEEGGRPSLSLKYDVHHIDGDKANNSIENLQILTKSEHLKIHAEIARRTLVTIKCKVCGDEFQVAKSVRKKPGCCSVECFRFNRQLSVISR